MEKSQQSPVTASALTASSALALLLSGCREKAQYDPVEGGKAYGQYSATAPEKNTLGDQLYYGAHDVGNCVEGCGQGAALVLAVSLAFAFALRKILR